MGVIVWDTKKNKKTSFKGLKGVKALFTDLFANLKDLSTFDSPLIEVQETAWPASCCGEFPTGMVFLVWENPGCGYDKVTDTFIFRGDKIMRQNIVVFTNDVVEELKSGVVRLVRSEEEAFLKFAIENFGTYSTQMG